MSLYTIDLELMELMEAIDPETGEWVGDQEAWERLNMERDAKIENTGLYIKDLRVDIAGHREEIRRLQAKVKTMENKIAWLSENLKRSLNGESFETTRCSLRFKVNPYSVKIDDEDQVMRWAEIYAPDAIKYAEPELKKAELKKIIASGDTIPGAHLEQEVRLEVK